MLNDFVGESASSSLQLSVSALVDEFADGLEVGIAPGDVRIRDSQHTQRRLVQLNKGGVVDLTESKQLQNLSARGRAGRWGKRRQGSGKAQRGGIAQGDGKGEGGGEEQGEREGMESECVSESANARAS